MIQNLDTERTKEQILIRLQEVIDPETKVDVVRMRLVEDLKVDEYGRVSYIFRPSSALCPIAAFLVQQIKWAVQEVPGVKEQSITVKDYVSAEELTEMINKENLI